LRSAFNHTDNYTEKHRRKENGGEDMDIPAPTMAIFRSLTAVAILNCAHTSACRIGFVLSLKVKAANVQGDAGYICEEQVEGRRRYTEFGLFENLNLGKLTNYI
jgi:hypothetical protein